MMNSTSLFSKERLILRQTNKIIPTASIARLDPAMYAAVICCCSVNAVVPRKIEIENAILSTKVSCIVLRVSNVYGPGQPHGRGQGVIAEWKNSINSKKGIEVYGSLKSFRDYIFIDDLCEAVQQSLDIGEGQWILNLGSGIPTQLGEILEFVSSLRLQNTKIEFRNSRLTDRNGYFLDISKFKSLTGWKPKYTIQNGLMKTFGVEIAPE